MGAAKAPADAAPASRPRKRILVVDDEPAIVEALGEVLSERGFEVSGAATAEEGLAAFRRAPADVVLLDKSLPDRDGLSLIEPMLTIAPVTSIIVITAYPSVETAVEALRLGAEDYLSKPFALADVLARVDRGDDADHGRLVRERRALVQELSRAREGLAALIDASFDPIVGLDVRGNVTRWNRGAHDLYGYTAAEMGGRPLEVLDLEAAQARARLARAVAGEAVRSEQVMRLRKSGSGVEVLLSLTPLSDAAGALTGFVEVSKDLTAQKATQRDLIQADRLVTLGRLAASFAHEINNPLASVRSNLSLVDVLLGRALDEGQSAERSAEARAELRTIIAEAQGAIDQIRQTIQHLRGFSRGGEDELREIDVQNAVLDAVHLFEPKTSGSTVKLVTHIRETPAVPCFPGRITQAVLNLLDNAYDALGGKGTITMTVGSEGKGVAIVVADDGPGIPPELQERVFDPFFTTKPVGEGTGLGLAICRQIVVEHRGKITLESALGRGATFRLWFPEFDAQRFTVLIVDDNDQVRSALRRLLRIQGFNVVEAGDAQGARVQLDARPVHLAIVDYRMPGRSGADLMAEMRRDFPRIYRMLITASDSVVESVEIRERAAPHAAFAKPWDDKKLLETLRRLLSSPASSSPPPGPSRA